MDVILRQYPLDQTGTFDIRCTVTIDVSAQDARKLVQRWLLLHVSHMMGADEPVLEIGEQAMWRVPVHLSTPSAGIVGQIGEVALNAVSGQIQQVEQSKVDLAQRAEKLIQSLPSRNTPPFGSTIGLPKEIVPAPIISLNEESEPYIVSATND